MVLEANNLHAELEKSTRNSFERAYKEKKFYTKIMEGRGDPTNFTVEDGLIFCMSENQVEQRCVPESRELKLAILNNHQDARTVAHPCIERTANAVKMWFWRNSMLEDIKTYVRTCKTCMRYKTSIQKKQGMIQPIAIP
ncbi:FOG: Transposon-encoded proteins with TYA, reverse transcriptase, integrase domains in various combinations [Plasmopara halstedii]|uniref:FOG: Transposon-encoded proteins with TYA, reverse transcriptase, integrase domains in various combinations n=1 Tax=Plasmopara halstedii TaxID=4781 RepID=A0A0P1AXQ9_PLAHL|nr:FOG: Transposon-encoded proteins with TYA, reverse transcriptase, integrase domains in various combinations [Plasmopara halstedii]CEG47236.1 FOG: Transposon-encoded proteins with TYA, reverse transcriptase, integrase domains in various combinations [Plasmopara halstedii]|eukprot:XP_024583605.1 FOG: Transposon-encoded proteins with TYA, reverse transcriptase, integrase domains in various combinations [Plasmopara halstedii]